MVGAAKNHREITKRSTSVFQRPRFQQCSSGNEHTCLSFSQHANTPSISHRSLFTSYLAYAFIAGPSAPGDVPPSMHRVISACYFDYICLPSARAAITYSSSFVGQDPNGLHMVNWWRERLNQDDVRNVSCLEIREVEGRIFDYLLKNKLHSTNSLVFSVLDVFFHSSMISETLLFSTTLFGHLSFIPLLMILLCHFSHRRIHQIKSSQV